MKMVRMTKETAEEIEEFLEYISDSKLTLKEVSDALDTAQFLLPDLSAAIEEATEEEDDPDGAPL